MDHKSFRNMYLLLSVFKLLSNRSYNEKEEKNNSQTIDIIFFSDINGKIRRNNTRN